MFPVNSQEKKKKKSFFNTRIYNLSCSPHIAFFSAVAAKKRQNIQ